MCADNVPLGPGFTIGSTCRRCESSHSTRKDPKLNSVEGGGYEPPGGDGVGLGLGERLGDGLGLGLGERLGDGLGLGLGARLGVTPVVT